MSLDEQRALSLGGGGLSPKRGLKKQNGRFPSKSELHLKKLYYKVSLCKTVCDKVVPHSLAYRTVQKLLVGFYRST